MEKFCVGILIWCAVAEVLCFGDFIYQIIRKSKEGAWLSSRLVRNAFNTFIFAPYYAFFLLAGWVFELQQLIGRLLRK